MNKLFLKKIPGITEGYRLLKRTFKKLRGMYRGKRASDINVDISVKIPEWRNIFAGYYDLNPFQPSNENILLVHANQRKAWLKPSHSESTSILLIDWKQKKVVKKLGETYAWNWQQGSRALWYDREHVLFNDYDVSSDRYITRMVDTVGEEKLKIPMPVQGWDEKHKRIFSFYYEALTFGRPDYGYFNRKVNKNLVFENRIESYDVESGNRRVYLTVSELIKDASLTGVNKLEKVRINHVLVTPDGLNLVFLFRYQFEGVTHTDLYLLDIDKGNWKCLLRNKGVSHYCWLNNQTLLATMKGDNGFGYYKIDIYNEEIRLLINHVDGHPTSINDETILSDSYPDKYANRHLNYILHGSSTKFANLMAFPEPLLFQGVTRCDLHPSLSKSGEWVQVDMAIRHKRCVGIIKNPFFNNL